MVEFNADILNGIKVSDLTPAQLAQFKSALAGILSTVETRSDEIKKSLESEVFGEIGASVAKLMTDKMAWAKLPAVMLTPDADGKVYTVSYYVAPSKKTTSKKDGDTKRAASTADTGKVTINKIGVAKGGIAFFQDNVTGKQYEEIKALVKELKQPADSKNPGASEADRCWDISKKGLAASDIVTRYHADAVTLIYNDGKQQLVKDAVAEMEAARSSTQPAETNAPAQTTETQEPAQEVTQEVTQQ
jgi:hypothetical protein